MPPPTTAERSRMLGIEDFGPALRLTDLQLYNAQGNAFDRTALMMRIRAGLLTWARGDHLPPADFPPRLRWCARMTHYLPRSTRTKKRAGAGSAPRFPPT